MPNLGNGAGFSVQQVIDTARSVTGREIPLLESPRRVGDAARLVADAGAARAVLGRTPKRPNNMSFCRKGAKTQREH